MWVMTDFDRPTVEVWPDTFCGQDVDPPADALVPLISDDCQGQTMSAPGCQRRPELSFRFGARAQG